MNCAYHPDVPAVAYCQYCGKPLCKDCVRNVGGSVFCESCLADRLRTTGDAPAVAASTPVFTGTPHPLLAALLGFIPGVGAMYNGQYAKAIAHVLIFAVLSSLSSHSSVFGLLTAAWVFYQVFDAYQTAVARRDGLPLPNPFGLNDIAQRLGIQSPQQTGWFRQATPPPPAAPASAGWQPVSGSGQQQPQPQTSPSSVYSGFVPQEGQAYPPPPPTGQPGYAPYYPPMPPMPPTPTGYNRDVPVGAIILIALGLLFLFSSLGILHEDWIAHGWPLLIIGLGLWMIFRRTQGATPPPPPPPAPEPIHSAGHSMSAPAASSGFTPTGPTDAPGGAQ